LLQLQKLIKSVVKETLSSETPGTEPGLSQKPWGILLQSSPNLETHNMHYFTYYPKSLKPNKAVIRHLPLDTPAQYISDGLMDVSFDVITVKKMPTTLRSPSEGTLSKNVPPIPHYFAEKFKIPRDLQLDSPLPHINQGGGIQGSERPYAMPQLPTVWPRLGKL
jgi:hypothetical protein